MEAEAIMREILATKCDVITDGKDYKEKLDKLENQLQEFRKDIDYRKYDIDSDKSFEAGCLVIGKEFGKDAKTMSVMEFESAVKILNDRAREQKERSNRNKRR